MDLSKHTQRPRRTQQALHTASQSAYAPVCKGMFTIPPPVNISQHFGLPNNCARIGSLLSAPAACYMHAPAPEPQGVDLRAPAEAPLGRGALCSFIASVKKMESQRPRRPGARFFFSHTPPPHFSWGLRDFCEHQPVFHGACNNVANVNRISVAFATMLQTSTVSPWPLQQCCERQPYLRGLCNKVASSAARVITHY